MTTERLKELLAMSMIGDGLLAMLYPERHTLLWDMGPAPLRNLLEALADRPALTRLLGAAELGTALWLARRQYTAVED